MAEERERRGGDTGRASEAGQGRESTRPGGGRAEAGAGLSSGSDRDANVSGAAPRGEAEYGDERPNFGSARSDYGGRAYGGTLDEQGTGGASADTFGGGGADRGAGGYSSPGRVSRSAREAPGGGGALTALLVGVGIGGLLMYMLDPERGRTRRKLVGDKLVKWTNDLSDAAGSKARDLRNRAQGVVAEARGALGGGGGQPAGQGRIDEVGRSGVYPVSASEGASPDAMVHGEASWGQGERGAAGYEDSGGSELTHLGEGKGVIGGATEGESGAYKRAGRTES